MWWKKKKKTKEVFNPHPVTPESTLDIPAYLREVYVISPEEEQAIFKAMNKHAERTALEALLRRNRKEKK